MLNHDWTHFGDSVHPRRAVTRSRQLLAPLIDAPGSGCKTLKVQDFEFRPPAEHARLAAGAVLVRPGAASVF